MSKQIWTTKQAQNIQQGDFISNKRGNMALEVIKVKIESEKILVTHYSDLYKLHQAIYEMQVGQRISVAVSGVKHMDIITNNLIAD